MLLLRRRTGATTPRPCRCVSASGRRARVPSWPSAASSGRRHVGPSRLPTVGSANQRPEGLAFCAPVLGRRFHGVECLGRLVPMPAAEVLAFLEDHHPALGRKPRQVLQSAGKSAPVGAELVGKAKRTRHLVEKVLLV